MLDIVLKLHDINIEPFLMPQGLEGMIICYNQSTVSVMVS